jgi:putative acetyltransferase
MEKVTIRSVISDDNAPLARLIRAVFDEHNAPKQGTVYSDPTTDHLFETFQIHGSVLWVAEVNGELLGLCGIYPTPGLDADCAELVKFYLLEKARGKGIGRALMQRSIQSASEFGYKRLYLESRPEFAKAVRIYEQLGFERRLEPMGNSGHSSCNIWMIKTL